MAETNVAAVFNSTGCLEFRQGEPGNASGPLLLRFNSTGNGIDLQIANTATAGANSFLVPNVCNFSFRVTDNTGTTYYIPASASLW